MLTHCFFSRGNAIGLRSCNFAVQDETENGGMWTAGATCQCLRACTLFISLNLHVQVVCFPKKFYWLSFVFGLYTMYVVHSSRWATSHQLMDCPIQLLLQGNKKLSFCVWTLSSKKHNILIGTSMLKLKDMLTLPPICTWSPTLLILRSRKKKTRTLLWHSHYTMKKNIADWSNVFFLSIFYFEPFSFSILIFI
jgi:hypothetical protein